MTLLFDSKTMFAGKKEVTLRKIYLTHSKKYLLLQEGHSRKSQICAVKFWMYGSMYKRFVLQLTREKIN